MSGCLHPGRPPTVCGQHDVPSLIATTAQLLSNVEDICAAYTGQMSEPDWAPLTGFRVAVTSARRADELTALLERGAQQ